LRTYFVHGPLYCAHPGVKRFPTVTLAVISLDRPTLSDQSQI